MSMNGRLTLEILRFLDFVYDVLWFFIANYGYLDVWNILFS